MSNSVDPDETAHYEPSHLDPCCLQKPIIARVKVFSDAVDLNSNYSYKMTAHTSTCDTKIDIRS